MLIIKGMDMPKSCEECKWHIDFYIEEEQVGGLCTITEKDDKEKSCPLVKINDIRYEAFKEFERLLLKKIENHILYGEE